MSVPKSDDDKEMANEGAKGNAQTKGGQGEPGSQSGDVRPGRVEYLVAVRPSASLHPTATDMMFAALSAMPDVEIMDRIQPSGVTALGLGGVGGSSDVFVIRTTLQRGLELQMTADPSVAVERNQVLVHLADQFDPQFSGVPAGLPLIAPASIQVQFKVVDDKRQPIQKAHIFLYGGGFPIQGETDAQGVATLTLFGGTLDTVQAVYVKPFADFWEKWIPTPMLNDRGVNTISLDPLTAFREAGLGNKPFLGWGQRLMGVGGQSAGALTGQGSRVAIVDSGCDNKHSALTHIKIGRDYTNLDTGGKPDQNTWAVDTVSHGTHCAGIIAGNGQGIRGFAPAAEVHILKLFPGGAFDKLISALKYAIDNQIDVVNCSLGSNQSSEIVQQWMEHARQAGVAVVVAAGNSAGPVQFPASSPSVLSVAAIGQQGQYPADTYHAQSMPAMGPGVIGINGVFAAKFSCYGPQVKVCAPGVAIVSSVPGGGYAAWDGTSMAAPHIAGLAALVAAHHPAVKLAARNAARVDRIFQTVLAAAMPVGVNPVYGGAGLPSVSAAFQASIAPQSFEQGEDIVRKALLAAMNQYSSGLVQAAAATQQNIPGGFMGQLQRS